MAREAGILLPIFSLPSKYGIGCFSKEAYDFVDWLKDAGQTYWQILPLCQTSYGDSPYQSFSTFAGNPYFISLEDLIEEGVLTQEECDAIDYGGEEDDIDYAYALECLWQAHEKVKEAYWLALADASSKKQAVSLAKYDDLAEAGPYLDAALAEVTGLELASKVNLTYCVSQLKMDNLTLFHDIYLDSSFGDLRLRDQIMKLLEAIKEMHEEVERMWNGINAK